MRITTKLLVTALAVTLTIELSHAAISIVDRFDSTSTVDGFDYTFSGSTLDFTGASKLVVAVGSEGSQNNGAHPTAIDSLTFGGVSLTQILPTGPDSLQNRTSLFYLDLDAVSFTGTDFFLDFVDGTFDNRGYGLSAYTLSGTKAGVSASSSLRFMQSTPEPDITTPTANEFLIGSWSRNTAGNYPDFPVGSPLTNDFTAALDGQYSFAAVSGQLGAAGDYDPEPSVFALSMMGFGALWLLRRRKR
jgi:hypothetical protein